MIDSDTKHKVSRIFLTTVIFGLFALLFLPFFTPILVAVLFAFALEPFMSRFAIKPTRRRLPALFFLFSFFILTAGPIFFVFFRFTAKLKEFSRLGFENMPVYKGLEKMYHSLSSRFSDLIDMTGLSLDSVNPSESGNLLSSVATFLIGQFGEIAAKTPQFLIGLFVFTIALYFFLTESKLIKKAVWSLDLLSPKEIQQITIELQKGSYITLVSSAITGAIQATFIAISGLIFGYNEFLILFVITFFVSFIPVVGAAPVGIFLALLSFVQDDYTAGIGLLIASGIAGSIDNLVRPILATSSEDDISPIISLLAIVGAVLLFGFIGVLLGPVLTRLAFKIIPILFSINDKVETPAPAPDSH